MLQVGEADDPATKLSLMDGEVKSEDARSFLASHGVSIECNGMVMWFTLRVRVNLCLDLYFLLIT
jgi:hypothetical protein